MQSASDLDYFLDDYPYENKHFIDFYNFEKKYIAKIESVLIADDLDQLKLLVKHKKIKLDNDLITHCQSPEAFDIIKSYMTRCESCIDELILLEKNLHNTEFCETIYDFIRNRIKKYNYFSLHKLASPLIYREIGCEGLSRLLDFFLDKGYDINETNDDRWTSLHELCSNVYHIKIILVFLKKGANRHFRPLKLNRKTKIPPTPLALARKNYSIEDYELMANHINDWTPNNNFMHCHRHLQKIIKTVLLIRQCDGNILNLIPNEILFLIFSDLSNSIQLFG